VFESIFDYARKQYFPSVYEKFTKFSIDPRTLIPRKVDYFLSKCDGDIGLAEVHFTHYCIRRRKNLLKLREDIMRDNKWKRKH